MENIAARLHEVPTVRTPAQRWAGIAFVVALHLVAIYALATGLAVKFAKYVPTELVAHVVEAPPVEKTPPPPPPQVELTKPPPMATAPAPEIKIEQPQAAAPITTMVGPPAPPAPPAPAKPATPDTAASGIMNTHTIPPYPPVARRLTHQGTVRLKLSISAEGAITDVQVEKSSGFDELDQTATEWVKSHWRYHPAIQNGAPVASTTEAEVRFNLEEAR